MSADVGAAALPVPAALRRGALRRRRRGGGGRGRRRGRPLDLLPARGPRAAQPLPSPGPAGHHDPGARAELPPLQDPRAERAAARVLPRHGRGGRPGARGRRRPARAGPAPGREGPAPGGLHRPLGRAPDRSQLPDGLLPRPRRDGRHRQPRDPSAPREEGGHFPEAHDGQARGPRVPQRHLARPLHRDERGRPAAALREDADVPRARERPQPARDAGARAARDGGVPRRGVGGVPERGAGGPGEDEGAGAERRRGAAAGQRAGQRGRGEGGPAAARRGHGADEPPAYPT